MKTQSTQGGCFVPRLKWWIAVFCLFINLPVSYAQVVTDGTMGPALSLTGPDYQITHDLGTITGSNLFHSFTGFNIGQAESATFTGPDDIVNVVSRVTGGEFSSINGLLRSQVGQADFYLINPAGLIFGQSARVDVPAAFHASTADEIRFADGGVFSAVNPGASSLTVAQPEAFGFLSPQPAGITVNGCQLAFAPESRVSFSAGDIAIKGMPDIRAGLATEGGEIQLVPVGTGPKEIPVNGSALPEVDGRLNIANADLSVSGNGGGSLEIIAGSTHIDSSRIFADNTGSQDATDGSVIVHAGEIRLNQSSIICEASSYSDSNTGSIEILSDGLLELVDGEITTRVEDSARDAGDISINAFDLSMDGFSISSEAGAYSVGNAGNLSVNVKGLLEMLNGAIISTNTDGQGHAGNIEVNAGEFKIDNKGFWDEFTDGCTAVSSEASYNSEGNAGTVDITVGGLLEVSGGGQILSSTWSTGDAGRVVVRCGDLKIDGHETPDQMTGIACTAEEDSEGNAGTVDLTVDGLLEVSGSGQILSNTWSDGDAGNVVIQCGDLKIDGHETPDQVTGISCTAEAGSTGNAGRIDITVDNLLELSGSGLIFSSTWSVGDAGDVIIHSRDLKVDGHEMPDQVTGIACSAEENSTGNAGKVDITVDGLLEVSGSGQILSNTWSDGDAGNVIIQCGDLRIDGQETPDRLTGIACTAEENSTGNAGTVDIMVDGLLELSGGGLILSDTWASGDAGDVIINSRDIRIDGQETPDQVTGIACSAEKNSTGDAGTVDITVDGLLELSGGGQVLSLTWSDGDAGNIVVHSKNLRIDGLGLSDVFTGIACTAEEPDSAGNAGTVEITVDGLFEIFDGGEVSSSTWSAGDAGDVIIKTGALIVGGSGGYGAIISSDAQSGSAGNAGTIEISVDGLLEVINGGEISSETWSVGDAGDVIIHSKDLRIDSHETPDMYTGITCSAYQGSAGNAGTVDVTVDGLLEVSDSGEISSATWAIGDAGDVIIQSKDLIIDGSKTPDNFTGIGCTAQSGSEGDAGTVDISVDGLLKVSDGGQISSATWAIGDAGDVIIHSKDLIISGAPDMFTGIGCSAQPGSEGDAGMIEIIVEGLLDLVDGGRISNSTSAKGNAGDITIQAETVRIDNKGFDEGRTFIASTADAMPDYDLQECLNGNIDITAGDVQLLNGGAITISNFGVLFENPLNDSEKPAIHITADKLALYNDSMISAESLFNVPASDIYIDVNKGLILENSQITSLAFVSDGGDIRVNGPGYAFLQDGLITTSAYVGNGGETFINPRFLVMDNGFIQANTMVGTEGGDISVGSLYVIPEGNRLQVGGLERMEFQPGSGLNIIQAAAPEGNPGNIVITAPEVDISAALSDVGAGFLTRANPATDPCLASKDEAGGTLLLQGRGGMPEQPGNASAVSFTGERLKDICQREGENEAD